MTFGSRAMRKLTPDMTVVLIAPGEVSFSRPSATRERYGAAGRHPKSDYSTRFATYGERPTFTVKGYDEHRETRRLTSSLFQPTTIHSAIHGNPMQSRVKAFLAQVARDTGGDIKTLDFFVRLTLYVFDNMAYFTYGPRHCAKTIENECDERCMLHGLCGCEIWNNSLHGLPVIHSLYRTKSHSIGHA